MSSLIPQTIDVIAALRRGERRIAIPGLKGSSPALFVAELVRAGLDNPLVMTPTQEAAEEFCRELAFFTNGSSERDAFPGLGCRAVFSVFPAPGRDRCPARYAVPPAKQPVPDNRHAGGGGAAAGAPPQNPERRFLLSAGRRRV